MPVTPPPGPRPPNAPRCDGFARACWKRRAARSRRRCRYSPSPAGTTRRGWRCTRRPDRPSSRPPPPAPGRCSRPRRRPPPRFGRTTRRRARNGTRDGPAARPPETGKDPQGSGKPCPHYSTKGSSQPAPGAGGRSAFKKPANLRANVLLLHQRQLRVDGQGQRG